MTLLDLYKQIIDIGNQFNTWEIPMDKDVKLSLNNDNTIKVEVFMKQITDGIEVKPYLRPMSSMTKEEAVVISAQQGYMASAVLHNDDSFYDCLTKHLNYLNAHHLDYCGLIKKGLALEAPEGMYKE